MSDSGHFDPKHRDFITCHRQTGQWCPVLWGIIARASQSQGLVNWMAHIFPFWFSRFWVACGTTLVFSGPPLVAIAQSHLYTPLSLRPNREIQDTLSEKDIPTGQGGFARDYGIALQEGDQIVIDLKSDEFDTIVTLLAPDGSTVAENDDGPEGSTDSLLFTRITKSGQYVVRVRSFGESSGGRFSLKLTRMQPVDE